MPDMACIVCQCSKEELGVGSVFARRRLHRVSMIKRKALGIVGVLLGIVFIVCQCVKEKLGIVVVCLPSIARIVRQCSKDMLGIVGVLARYCFH